MKTKSKVKAGSVVLHGPKKNPCGVILL